MAFVAALTHDTVMGDVRTTMGTTAQLNTETGGNIDVKMSDIYYFHCTGMNTYTISGTTVTVETLDPGKTQAGHWIAIGYT